MTISTNDTRSKAESISKEVPELKQFGLLDNLSKSLEKQKANLRKDNPFLKVTGEYKFDIDTTKSASEKNEYIHNKISDYLFGKTGHVYVFKPEDNSKVYTLDTVASDKSTGYQVSKLLKDAPTDIQKLITQYPTIKKSKVTIKITTDPLDIVKKSTHQHWESCETVGGEFCQGIFSDIENNNAIAYVYIDDNKEADGRFMLRWCDTPKKKADIGIEPIMYPRKSYSMEIYDLLRRIIKSKGYGSYDSCTTPYRYEGYSDYLGGRGEITYHSGKSADSNRILIQYASLPNVSRNLALALSEHTTNRKVRRSLAENHVICDIDDVVNKLSKDIDNNTRVNLVLSCVKSNGEKENKLTETAINNLINDKSRKVREELAYRINNTDKKYFDKLSSDTPAVRRGLARNDEVCNFQDIANRLSQDTDDKTKINLIFSCTESNSEKGDKLSETALNNLVNDKSAEVRRILASRIKDKKYLDILLNDKYRYVTHELSQNRAICNFEDIVNKLSKDTEDKTKLNLIRTCGDKLTEIATNNLINDTSINVRTQLASTIKDKKHFGTLLEDKSSFVRDGLARNQEICGIKDIVNKLSKDIDINVKSSLIETCTESPNKLTETAINNLKNDKDEHIRKMIVKAINKK
jgi:hypothetical protein